MKLKQLSQGISNILVHLVCRRVTNLTLFNAAFFCVGEKEDADLQFKMALTRELARRGLLKSPRTAMDEVIDEGVRLAKFSASEIQLAECLFDSGADGPSVEDYYVKLFFGRNRWTERYYPMRKRRAANKVT